MLLEGSCIEKFTLLHSNHIFQVEMRWGIGQRGSKIGVRVLSILGGGGGYLEAWNEVPRGAAPPYASKYPPPLGILGQFRDVFLPKIANQSLFVGAGSLLSDEREAK